MPTRSDLKRNITTPDQDCTVKLSVWRKLGFASDWDTLHCCKAPHFLNLTSQKMQNSLWRSNAEEYEFMLINIGKDIKTTSFVVR